MHRPSSNFAAAGLALAAMTVPSAARAADPFTGRFPAESISRFDLDMSAGDVQITAEETIGLVTVDATPVAWPEGCSVDIGQDAERAWLRVDTGGALRTCRLDVAIHLGIDTVIALEVGQGNVKIVNLRGALTADIGAGDLLLDQMTGPLDVEMGSGQLEGTFSGPRLRTELGSGGVHLDELLSPVDIELGMGNVDLTWREAPTGRIDARTGTGSIRLLLPPDTPVDADLSLGIGTKRIRLPELEDAPTKIDVTSGVGRILVAPTESPSE